MLDDVDYAAEQSRASSGTENGDSVELDVKCDEITVTDGGQEDDSEGNVIDTRPSEDAMK